MPKALIHAKKPEVTSEQPQFVQTEQKGNQSRQYELSSGEAQRKRRFSVLLLDALAIIKVDAAVNHFISFSKESRLIAVNSFCFKDREKILGHGVVITVSTP